MTKHVDGLVFNVANPIGSIVSGIFTYIWFGQIMTTSHDLTPNGGLAREIPLFQGNLGWSKISSFGQIWLICIVK